MCTSGLKLYESFMSKMASVKASQKPSKTSPTDIDTHTHRHTHSHIHGQPHAHTGHAHTHTQDGERECVCFKKHKSISLCGQSVCTVDVRSEARRVGKECRSWWSP